MGTQVSENTRRVRWFVTQSTIILSAIVFVVVSVLQITGSEAVSMQAQLSFVLGTALALLITVSTQLSFLLEDNASTNRQVSSDLKVIREEGARHSAAMNFYLPKNSAQVEILRTGFEFYSALNAARSESKRSIRVMKLHQQGPQIDNPAAFDKEIENSDTLTKEQREMRRWYSGMASWLSVSGRSFERVQPTNLESMAQFKEMQAQLLNEKFFSHSLDWDGALPLVNVCIFDDTQIIVCFSTREWETQYRPAPGFRLKNKDIATMFTQRYYLRMVEFCKANGG